MTCLAGGTRLEARLYDGKGEPLSLSPSPLTDVVSGTTVDAKVAICRDATGMVRSSVYLGPWTYAFVRWILSSRALKWARSPKAKLPFLQQAEEFWQ